MSQPPAPSDLPAIPDHELLRRIGQGSYGEVWLARSVTGAFRAVKIIHRRRFDSDRPFDREFNGILKFEPVSRTHAGLVSILHVGQSRAGGYFYYVMEIADDAGGGDRVDPASYVPRTLSALLAGGPPPLAECVTLGVALTDALRHLHENGLVHRDLKPSNIIFVKGRPKLADIGLVTGIGEKATFVGTEGYFPPEGPGSPLADIYSLGKVLYEVCTGNACDQFPELPADLRHGAAPDLFRQLNDIVLRACDPQPSRRFPSAREMHAVLEGLRRGEQPTVRSGFPKEADPGVAVAADLLVLFAAENSNDVRLACALETRAAAAGRRVILEDLSELSLEWARRLELQIPQGLGVVFLLSPTLAQLPSASYAVELAAQAGQRQKGRPRLLPVLVQCAEPASRHLEVTLATYPRFFWEDESDDDRLFNELMDALKEPVG